MVDFLGRSKPARLYGVSLFKFIHELFLFYDPVGESGLHSYDKPCHGHQVLPFHPGADMVDLGTHLKPDTA